MGSLVKFIAVFILPLVACQYQINVDQAQLQEIPEEHQYLDIPAPEFFTFTASPLQKPESLQSRPYFDFLSTLYAHDAGKKTLFSQPPRSRRGVDLAATLEGLKSDVAHARQKRAIVFRPLFVYRQQEIRKQKIQAANSYRRY